VASLQSTKLCAECTVNLLLLLLLLLPFQRWPIQDDKRIQAPILTRCIAATSPLLLLLLFQRCAHPG
jgi:hypothetical protein